VVTYISGDLDITRHTNRSASIGMAHRTNRHFVNYFLVIPTFI